MARHRWLNISRNPERAKTVGKNLRIIANAIEGNPRRFRNVTIEDSDEGSLSGTITITIERNE